MLPNFSLRLLSGGFYHCSPSWNKHVNGFDRYYKFYFPVGGSAKIVIDGKKRTIKTGYCYFLSGFEIAEQNCDKDMDVYWIHFSPESLHFRYLLTTVSPFYRWNAASVSFFEEIATSINLLFSEPFARSNKPLPNPPIGLRSKIHSLLLYLIGDLFEKHGTDFNLKMDANFTRLKPSIEYMDKHFIENPSLSALARQSHLSSNYFHRLFTQKFGLTPLNYMLRRRIEYSQELLNTTTLSVKGIAKACGYDNEFYFSRIFKRHVGTSPSQFRAQDHTA